MENVIYSTMPSNNAEEDGIKGLLLFSSDYAHAYLDTYNSQDNYWHMLEDEGKSKMIEEQMPPPSDGGWQNRPYRVIAPDVMTVKTDALGRTWRAKEVYESRSRRTTLILYCGICSDAYGYEYVELVASEGSSMRGLSICRKWADGEASFSDIFDFLKE
jgi:hypothetical protein